MKDSLKQVEERLAESLDFARQLNKEGNLEEDIEVMLYVLAESLEWCQGMVASMARELDDSTPEGDK